MVRKNKIITELICGVMISVMFAVTAPTVFAGENQNYAQADLNDGSLKTGAYQKADKEDNFVFEVPSGWSVWTTKHDDEEFASPDREKCMPYIFVEKCGSDMTQESRERTARESFANKHSGNVLAKPEIITYVPEGTDRNLSGFKAVYAEEGSDAEYTQFEYFETIGEDVYRYQYVYVSKAGSGEEQEDETTYSDFLHAIDTMQITA